ncbi:MAG TPA: sigma-70 family RNA polymerase sigma factor [Fimbriimonadaceae bacterium]|nr:sigma-70 family RNA polymerase sigma factor [Fimbriimonadaceae bacterium]
MPANPTPCRSHPHRAAQFAAFIDGSYQQVFEIAYRLSGNRQDAEDLTQEACVRAWTGFRRFDGSKPFIHWMYRIVIRLYFDMLRYRRRRVSGPSLDAPVASKHGDAALVDPADHRRNPEEELLCALLGPDLQDALNSLSPPQRALVRMLDLEDWDRASLADATSTAEGTLRSRLHRAHRAMEARLSLPAEEKAKTYDPGQDPALAACSASQAAPHGSIAELANQMYL